jgi:hypothetical protein
MFCIVDLLNLLYNFLTASEIIINVVWFFLSLMRKAVQNPSVYVTQSFKTVLRPFSQSCGFIASLVIYRIGFISMFARFRKWLLSSSHVCVSLCPSAQTPALMEQLDSHWTYFHEMWYFTIFRKSVHKIQISVISYKNNGYFTRSPIYVFNHISFISSLKNVCDKRCREKRNLRLIFSNFLLKIVPFVG